MKCHECDKKGKYGDFIIGKDGRGRCTDCNFKIFESEPNYKLDKTVDE